MKTLKNILLAAAIGFSGITTVVASNNGNTGAPAGIAASYTIQPGVPFTILTNNLTIFSVQILSTNLTFVNFYDCSSTNLPYSGTNYVTAAYPAPQSYTTNLVTSYVGSNGYTNWYTNANVQFTYSVTNAAATNALAPIGSFAAIPNVVASYGSEMLFSQGVTVWSPLNATIIFYYRPNR